MEKTADAIRRRTGGPLLAGHRNRAALVITYGRPTAASTPAVTRYGLHKQMLIRNALHTKYRAMQPGARDSPDCRQMTVTAAASNAKMALETQTAEVRCRWKKVESAWHISECCCVLDELVKFAKTRSQVE